MSTGLGSLNDRPDTVYLDRPDSPLGGVLQLVEVEYRSRKRRVTGDHAQESRPVNVQLPRGVTVHGNLNDTRAGVARPEAVHTITVRKDGHGVTAELQEFPHNPRIT